MITPIVAALALLNYQEGRWVPTSVTPSALAQRVDNALAQLKTTTLKYRYDFQGQIGRAFAICEGTVVKPGVFRLQVPAVDPVHERNALNIETWVSDGKRFGKAVEPADVIPGPISKRPGAPAQPLAMWPFDFSKVILSGLGQPTKPLTKFVAAASKAGFKSDLKSRTITFERHRRTWYLLVLTRGNARYEMLVDALGYLPVSIKNNVNTAKASWSEVNWNMRPGKTLQPSKVNFQKKGATLPLAP